MSGYMIFLSVVVGIIAVTFMAIIVVYAIKCILDWIDDIHYLWKNLHEK